MGKSSAGKHEQYQARREGERAWGLAAFRSRTFVAIHFRLSTLYSLHLPYQSAWLLGSLYTPFHFVNLSPRS